MKSIYTNEHASAEVVVSKALNGMDGVLELINLKTDDGFQKQGFGTQLLLEICNEADSNGIVLMLHPRKDWLINWYKRFNFKRIQSSPIILMARSPRISVKFTEMAIATHKATHG